MGKPTGFLEYQRQANPAEDPQARIRHYQEFHPRLDREAVSYTHLTLPTT